LETKNANTELRFFKGFGEKVYCPKYGTPDPNVSLQEKDVCDDEKGGKPWEGNIEHGCSIFPDHGLVGSMLSR
jgi:hypothetical protein